MKWNLAVNPVMARESRVRMRGWRAPALISLYVGLLGSIVLLVLYVIKNSGGNGGFAPELGGYMYAFLTAAQFALLLFSVPGLTAGAISGERERQTLDLLLITRMSPLQVVVGKLGAALGFSVLLMLASLPVYSILFLFGGISLYRLFLTALVYIVTVVLLGSIGMYFSALFKRTQGATVATYGTAFGLILVPFIMSLLVIEIIRRGPNVPPPAWSAILAYINPLFGLASAAGGPLGQITSLYQAVITNQEAIWWRYALVALVSAAILQVLTARKINPLKQK
jgi:ABC-2 type transport system permease protein